MSDLSKCGCLTGNPDWRRVIETFPAEAEDGSACSTRLCSQPHATEVVPEQGNLAKSEVMFCKGCAEEGFKQGSEIIWIVLKV